MPDSEKVIRIIDELIFEAQKEPTWKAENALRCLKKELLKAVVRCKDCKHGYTLTDSAFVTCGRRFHDGQKHEADWFCADGERKDGE